MNDFANFEAFAEVYFRIPALLCVFLVQTSPKRSFVSQMT